MEILLGVVIGVALALVAGGVPRRLIGRRSRREVRAIQSALHASTVMLPYLRRGLSEESAQRTVEHLKTLTMADAVALGDRHQVLAYIGAGEDHHASGDPLIPISAPAGEDHLHVEGQIDCPAEGCPLGPAIAAPLFVNGEVVGSIAALYRRGHQIDAEDTRTVAQAAKLVSAQLELAVIAEQTTALATAEMTALRAQISPHFIYNALAAIASYIHSKPDEARELLTEFAEFIRYAFRGQESFVSLADELSYVSTYLRLEQARFGDRLQVQLSMPTEALDTVVPVLSLQPLVENAVRHGVEKRGEGTISIAVRPLNGHISLRVSDNGVGMTPERIAEVLDGRGDGVGIANVQARLLASFGPGYGLEIESVPGMGTSVTMRLPEPVRTPVAS